MDKWLTLIQAANGLNINEHDLLDLAIDKAIMLTWQPLDFIHVYSIDMSTGEARYFDDKTPYPYDEPIDSLREGYFVIDLTLSPGWKSPLKDIKLEGKGYGRAFGTIDPLVVREIGTDGYIWSVTPPPELDTGKELDFPTMQTLGVFQKELERYKNQIAIEAIIGSSPKRKMRKQGDAILDKLNELAIMPKKISKSQKDTIEKSLKTNSLFNAETAFKNAWQWLIDNDEIKTY